MWPSLGIEYAPMDLAPTPMQDGQPFRLAVIGGYRGWKNCSVSCFYQRAAKKLFVTPPLTGPVYRLNKYCLTILVIILQGSLIDKLCPQQTFEPKHDPKSATVNSDDW